MDARRFLIPRRLDDPPKFFFWDLDVAVVFSTIMMFGIVADMFVIPAALATGAAMGFTKLKQGQQKGFGVHALYWHLPVTLGFKRTPASCIREFVG
jgi:conjugal transfer pilus assembly protein TraL